MPRRGVEPRPAASNTAVQIRHTRGARLEARGYRLEVGQRQTPCCSSSRLKSQASGLANIPTWIRTRARTFGGSDAIRYTIGIQFLKEPTTGFAPASTCLQDRRLSVSSHVGGNRPQASDVRLQVRRSLSCSLLPEVGSLHQARARGVEPRPSALETDCSPRSTLVCCRPQAPDFRPQGGSRVPCSLSSEACGLPATSPAGRSSTSR